MTWTVAAERSLTEPAGASPACAVPAGTVHAVDPSGSVACGRSAGGLERFPELTWPPAGMAAADVCADCEAATG